MEQNEGGQSENHGSGGGGDGGGLFTRLSTIEKLVTLAGAVAVVVQTIVTIGTSMQVSKVENQLKVEVENRERSKDYAGITKDVFEAIKEIQVTDAPVADRVDRLLVASAYVQVIPDIEVRDRFRDAIRSLLLSLQSQIAAQSSTAEGAEKTLLTQQSTLLENLGIQIDDQALDDKAAAADANPATAPAPVAAGKAGTPDWSNYDFDIFWCQTSDTDASMRAQNLASAIHKLGIGAARNWRLRPLPELTNAQPGYGVRGFEIRTSSPDEYKFAEKLKLDADKLLNDNKITSRFRILRTRKDTRWYISVFACPT